MVLLYEILYIIVHEPLYCSIELHELPSDFEDDDIPSRRRHSSSSSSPSSGVEDDGDEDGGQTGPTEDAGSKNMTDILKNLVTKGKNSQIYNATVISI